ncbi:MAG: Abi family protein [Bacteroidetes bacterium]|nr:Abi family protein [Bacteroidota bacterium]HET6245078.1 Abi family protein [Bacteroidia bacterium]
MSKKPFSKPFLSYLGQVEILKNRGLIIENEQKALHVLENISYYRLSGYWYPLLENKKEHKFKTTAKFLRKALKFAWQKIREKELI